MAALSAVSAVSAGCASPRDDRERFPPLEDTIAVIETIPAQGDADFDPRGQIDFCFSDYLDPAAISELDAALYSGRIRFDSELDIQLFAWRPPGEPSGVSDSAWCPGSVMTIRPRDPLEAGLLYRVRLRASAVGWAGELLDTSTPGWTTPEYYDDAQTFWLEFTTAIETGEQDPEQPDDAEQDDPGPTLGDLFAPGEVFDPQSPTCGCHREPGLARELVDLSSPASAFDDLVRDQTPRSTGAPLVSPRNPSESYLVQTLLRDDDNGGEALHAVLGDPMPPDEPLGHAHMTSIARWIEDGALP